MRAILAVALVAALAGCTLRPAPVESASVATLPPGPVCVPIAVNATNVNASISLVSALVRNCANESVFIATRICDAPWTNVTIAVRQIVPGRLPTTWGVLEANGSARFPFDGPFEESCPSEFVPMAPGEERATLAVWNGSALHDVCNDQGLNASFTCPRWTQAPEGLFSFEARAWLLDGDMIEARAFLARGSATPDLQAKP